MIYDEYKELKIFFSVIIGILWIYYRTSECYNLLPRKSFYPAIFVGIWIYINYYEPLVLPIGLLILAINGIYFK